MFRISTNDARTDLYGIGKGAAQVVDLTPLRDQAKQQAAFEHADQTARRKRQEDLIDKAAEFDSSVLKPNDIPALAKQQDELSSWLQSKISTKGELSVADQLEFNRRKAQIKTGALNSAASRTYANELLKKHASEPPGTYEEEDVQNIKSFLSDPSHAGNYDTAPLALNKKFDYGKYVSTVLAPAADRMAGNNSKQGVETHTIEQANEDIAKSLADPVNYRAVSKEIETDKKTGVLPQDFHDVVGYAQNKYAPTLVSNKTPIPSASWANFNANQQAKQPTVTEIPPANTNGEGTYVVDKTNIPADKVVQNLVIGGKNVAGTLGEVKYKIEDGKKVITGGTLIPFLTEDDKQTIADNKVKKAQWNNDVEAYAKVHPRPDPSRFSDKEDLDKAIDKWSNGLPKLSSERYKQEPVNDKPIKIDKNQAISIAFNKYGLNIPELAETGSTKANILKVEKESEKQAEKDIKMTPSEWSSKWGSLKKGGSLVGLDGKTYTKK